MPLAIITTDSLGSMVDVHDRRPVALSSELDAKWRATATLTGQAEPMASHQGEPSEAFEWYRVDAHLIRPIYQ